jgi:CubicO group peptidase (beta-lactamase class C family)
LPFASAGATIVSLWIYPEGPQMSAAAMVIARRALMAVASTVVWTRSTMAQGQTGMISLDAELIPYLKSFGLPAVAAAAVKDGKILAVGAVGTRRIDAATPVTLQDRFHIGSDTKAMTSLLAAILVEEGKLRWNTSVGEI